MRYAQGFWKSLTLKNSLELFLKTTEQITSLRSTKMINPEEAGESTLQSWPVLFEMFSFQQKIYEK